MSQQGYIGRNPGDGRTIVNRQTSHVTTGVQTSFTMTAGYEIGYLDVYLNGIKQTETLDYTASDGSTINFALSFPPVNGDVLEFVAFETLNITNIKSARRNFTVGQDLDVSGNVTIGSSFVISEAGKTILEAFDQVTVYCDTADAVDVNLAILSGVS